MNLQAPIAEVVENKRNFFLTGQTKNIQFRLEKLRKLKTAFNLHERAIIQALKADLGRPEVEAFTSEIVLINQEIEHAIKHLKTWSQAKNTNVPWQLLPATASIYPEPLGVILIIGAWNYPFQLNILPLIGAIAAGNCVIIKPSEYAPQTSCLIAEIVGKIFDEDYISVIEGDVTISQQLLAQRFDHIFFTGSATVGKIIMSAAAQNLIPVTLELGGKSPCIVDVHTDIPKTARRITWGKFSNAGQACIAPDYLLVHKDIKFQLLENIKKSIQEFYGENPANSPDYGRIINLRQFDRLIELLSYGEITIGGETNREQLYIAPTIVDRVSWQNEIMVSEIFGPILPVLTYEDITEAIARINSQPKPLALYFFSQNKHLQKRIIQETSSGGVCFNDTLLQYCVPTLPFGGIGNSGIGNYHGKASFDTFSHYKSVLHKPFFLASKLLYPPYKDKLSLLKKILNN